MAVLCSECDLKSSQARTLEHNMRVSALNRDEQRLRSNLGLPAMPPRVMVPIQTVMIGEQVVNFSKITIHGNNYGVVNTGYLNGIDLVVNDMVQMPPPH
jgi:hypothetical protein